MTEELKVIISAEVSKLKQSVADAKKKIDEFTKDSEKGASKMDEAFKSLGTSLSTGFKAAATATAAVSAALVSLGATTAEYRAEQAKLITAFESAGSSAEVAKSTYNDLFRVLGDGGQATEAANHLAKLTTNQKDLSEWTNICQGVYATFGSSLPIESLTEAANETAKTGTLTGSLADALNWAGVSEDAFAESLAACNSEAEREALIRETLSGLYSDASAKYEENNAQVLAQNEAQAKLQETTAKLGEVMQPVITAFTSFANDALAAVSPYIEDLANNLIPVLKDGLEGAASLIEKALNFISQNWELLATIGGIISGIAIAIGLYNAVAAIKAAMDAAQVATLGALIAAYLAQAAAMIVAIAPYLLIVAAIAAVIAIIVLCVKHWDKIKEATKKAWDSICEAVKVAIDWVINLFKKIFDWIKENWQGLLLLIINPFAGAFKLVYDNCETFRNAINKFIEKIKSIVAIGFNFVKTKIITPIKNAFASVKETFSNIYNTIVEKIEAAKNKVSEIIEKIKGFFKFEWSLPKLKLPSVSIKGKFSLSPLEVPKFSINWNKLGGIFDKPTLFNYGGSLQGIGEDGAEAVVPLEKNTEWLDRIAERLNGNGAPIILQVDGKTFAEISVNSINQLTKQRGSLPLRLV